MADEKKVKIKIHARSLIEHVIREAGEIVEVEAETAKVLADAGAVTIVTDATEKKADEKK